MFHFDGLLEPVVGLLEPDVRLPERYADHLHLSADRMNVVPAPLTRSSPHHIFSPHHKDSQSNRLHNRVVVLCRHLCHPALHIGRGSNL